MGSTGGRCRCGSTLSSPDAVGLVTCGSCGRVTRADEPDLGEWTGSSAPPDRGLPVDERVPWVGRSLDTATAGRRARGCGLAMVGVVFVVALGIATAGFLRIRNTAGDVASSGNARIVVAGSVVPLGADGPVDVMAVVQDYTDASHRYLVRLDLSGRRIVERWRSPELPPGIDRVHARLVGSTLVVAFDDRLWVLDADRGTRRWEAKLGSQVRAGCGACLTVAGDRVVVRTADAYLTGFGLDGPQPLWRRRLASTSAGVTVLGDTLVAVDDSPDVPGAKVRSIDPATGLEGVIFRPVCPSTDPARTPIPLASGDAVLAVPGTGDAVSVSAYGDGCAVRWEVATGTLRWATRIDGVTSVDAGTALVSSTDLVVSRPGGGLLHIDLPTGAVRALDSGPGVQARPALLVGRQVLAWTETPQGTAGGLEAFDLVAGRQQWAARLPGDPVPASAGIARAPTGDSPRAVLVRDAGQVDVTIFTEADRRLDVGRLDLASGSVELAPPRQYRTRYDRTAGPLSVEATGAGTVVVTVEGLLERIDASSGDIVTYP